MFGGDADRFVQVPGFEDEEAADLLLGLRKWTVGDHHLAFGRAQCGDIPREGFVDDNAFGRVVVTATTDGVGVGTRVAKRAGLTSLDRHPEERL
jgi:hypothetical protein